MITLAELKKRTVECSKNPIKAMNEAPKLVEGLLMIIEGMEKRIEKLEGQK